MSKCAVSEKILVVTDPRALKYGTKDYLEFRKLVTCASCGAKVSGEIQGGKRYVIDVKGSGCSFPDSDGKLIQIRETKTAPKPAVAPQRHHY